MAHESQLLELNTMTDEKPTVDDLLLRPNDYLLEHYEFGAEIIPQVRTHDQIVALLATMDQQGTDETYDPDAMLWENLHIVKDRIEDDLQGKIEDEYDE